MFDAEIDLLRMGSLSVHLVFVFSKKSPELVTGVIQKF